MYFTNNQLEMAGNIIPAIATTNAMVAGLCVLQAFKVMRENYDKAKTIYLTKSTDRIISSEPLRLPRKDCPVCRATYASLMVDMSRATIDDFVNILRLDLQYSEFSVSADAELLYDLDFEDNLKMKLSQLGVTNKTFLTVKDESDGEIHSDIIFAVIEKSVYRCEHLYHKYLRCELTMVAGHFRLSVSQYRYLNLWKFARKLRLKC